MSSSYPEKGIDVRSVMAKHAATQNGAQKGVGRQSEISELFQRIEQALAVHRKVLVELEGRFSPVLARVPDGSNHTTGEIAAQKSSLFGESLDSFLARIEEASVYARSLIDRCEL